MLIAADLTLIDGVLRPGFAISTETGRIAELRPIRPSDTPERRVKLLAPGLLDLQVNGGGGVLVNSNPTPDGLRLIRAAHLRLGTAAIMPTVITDSLAVLQAAADAAIACKDEPGLIGLHIEGPHIAPSRRGTHDPRHIRPLDRDTIQVLERLRQAGLPVVMTLAPELTDPLLLQQAAELGVILSAGHSAATGDETRAGLGQGITMFTHLFNAMPQMQSRDPGIIAAAILSEAHIGMIADGIHVHWDALRVAMAARPKPELCFLVSDAMPTVGGPDRFTLYGQTIHVQDGRLVNAEGALAGAHISLLQSALNLHHHAAVPLATALEMASTIPRQALRLPPLRLNAGLPLDQVLALDHDLAPVPLHLIAG